ncbi:hypothetical protein [Paenibacillus beijingensis]|uniref:Uncharacterized protein n=1 Tax=Paenibacillus beijingensis TaxID=1126833 RepID=A0A0D5NFU5_9BACL|nr:hypothetical protein [Paenibacillus beijingensis]AJY74025.1 hypothetical protein VN24_04665 [Paenibacillus beijingensis]
MPNERDMPGIKARLRLTERLLIGSVFCIAVLFTLLLIAVKWPNYWIYVAAEQTPMTWLQSVLWFGCALLALICCTLVYAQGGFRREGVVWLLLSAAYAFLMIDERFAFHERVRDNWLKQTGIKLLPWEEAGDFIPLVYAFVALLFLVHIVRVFRARKAALVWFIAAAALFALAVGMDSFAVSNMSKGAERLEQSSEEIVELLAVSSLFSSVVLMLFHYVTALMSGKREV